MDMLDIVKPKVNKPGQLGTGIGMVAKCCIKDLGNQLFFFPHLETHERFRSSLVS